MTTTTPVTDEWLQQAVLEEIKREGRIHPNEIGVIVHDGGVTLTGVVDAPAKRWAAQDAAEQVPGVRAVINDVEVHAAQAITPADDDLAAAVTYVLGWDAFVPAEELGVTVSDGWVTLTGNVEHAYQKLEAERVVRRVSGVKGISNELVCRAAAAPGEVQQWIRDALVRAAVRAADGIQVDMQAGAVTLSGAVGSETQLRAALIAAASAPGVTEVDNRLAVVPEAPPSVLEVPEGESAAVASPPA